MARGPSRVSYHDMVGPLVRVHDRFASAPLPSRSYPSRSARRAPRSQPASNQRLALRRPACAPSVPAVSHRRRTKCDPHSPGQRVAHPLRGGLHPRGLRSHEVRRSTRDRSRHHRKPAARFRSPPAPRRPGSSTPRVSSWPISSGRTRPASCSRRPWPRIQFAMAHYDLAHASPNAKEPRPSI